MIVNDVIDSIYAALYNAYIGLEANADFRITSLGYYPYDYDYVQSKQYSILLNPANYTAYPNMATNTSAAVYLYNCNLQVILFSFKHESDISVIKAILFLTLVINIILDALYAYKDNLTMLELILVLTGDINNFALPSDVGYNNNIIVRKLNFNFTLKK